MMRQHIHERCSFWPSNCFKAAPLPISMFSSFSAVFLMDYYLKFPSCLLRWCYHTNYFRLRWCWLKLVASRLVCWRLVSFGGWSYWGWFRRLVTFAGYLRLVRAVPGGYYLVVDFLVVDSFAVNFAAVDFKAVLIESSFVLLIFLVLP